MDQNGGSAAWEEGDGPATRVDDKAKREFCASELDASPMGGDSRTLLLWPSH